LLGEIKGKNRRKIAAPQRQWFLRNDFQVTDPELYQQPDKVISEMSSSIIVIRCLYIFLTKYKEMKNQSVIIWIILFDIDVLHSINVIDYGYPGIFRQDSYSLFNFHCVSTIQGIKIVFVWNSHFWKDLLSLTLYTNGKYVRLIHYIGLFIRFFSNLVAVTKGLPTYHFSSTILVFLDPSGKLEFEWL